MLKILLDAGHYGYQNQSPIYPQYYEAKQMWTLHLLLKKHLEANYEVEVGITRDDQAKDLAVTTRGKLAKGYDLFLSLHSNAAKSESVDRVDVYYSYENLNNAKELAELFVEAISVCMGVDKGTAKTRKSKVGNWEYYGVLRGARSVGCPLFFIIEHSFHTNKNAAKWLMSDSNLDKLAKVEAEVIAEYFGLKAKTSGFNIGFRLLKNGTSGEDVRAYQYALKGRGIKGADGKTIATDGKFGSNTEHATKILQRQFGLKDDGKAGPQTLTAAYTGTA